MRNLIYLILFIPLFASAQKTLNLDDWKNLKFRNIGPAGMSGRVTAIDVDLSDEKRIFLGSASGGVWLSENNGISFKPIFDDQNCLAIGSIKINQKNPSEIWVGTGEGNPRNSLNTGSGIFKSIDGGKTWKHKGLENTKTIHRIIIHRDDPKTVFAASLGSPWGPNDDRGVFRTTDGGNTWKKILYVDGLTGAADMVADPTNPNKIIVSMWEHQRQPWFFNSGGKSSGIYITYDGGDNWKKMTSEDGLPKGNLGRVGLAFAPSKPSLVYALVEAKENGLYKSEDGGNKWTLVSTKNIGGRPFYYNELYVDPLNENRIYNVHTYLSKSEDGGRTFRDIADYGNAVHPDHHAFWIHPKNPDFIIDGNDGGANISRDQGKNWTFISNLPVGQFYHINTDTDFPYNVYGGMQDNGSWAGPSAVLKSGGIRNSDFQEISFGDGFDVVPYQKDSRFGYTMSQGGSLSYFDKKTGNSKFIKPFHPDGLFLRFNWNAAIAQDPFNVDGVYYGSQFLHHSVDKGDNWSIVSPDLTTNDSTKLKQHLTGGLTLDATGAENHCTILAIAPSPKDKNVIWIGTDDGNLQLTQDGGKTWENLSKKLSGPKSGFWIPQIQVSKTNPGEAFVVVNDYRRNDFNAYAYHTNDFGKTFTRIADPSQIKNFVVSIVQDPVENNLLFLGTDGGLYVSFNKGKNWQLWNKGLPQTQIADMKIQEKERDLVIATFGRSIWILDDITPLRELAKADYVTSKFRLFDPSEAVNVSYKSVDGVRFFAQGDFTGDNDNIGSAVIYAWSTPKIKDSKENDGDIKKEKSDIKTSKDTSKIATPEKVKLFILNQTGDTIRKKSVKLEGGLEKIYWGLEMDGVRGLSSREQDKDADPPSGPDVLPGKYKMIAIYGSLKDSVDINVIFDPRIKVTTAELKSKQESFFELYKIREKAVQAYDRMNTARKNIKAMEALMEIQHDSVKTEVNKMHKSMKSKLDSLENLIYVPEDTKGIAWDDDKLSSFLGSASGYLGSSTSGITSNSRAILNQIDKKSTDLLRLVDLFYGEDWKKYQEKIDKLGIGLLTKIMKKD
jgi:photosystem II stability/assembly factor-like uncharacterized protein